MAMRANIFLGTTNQGKITYDKLTDVLSLGLNNFDHFNIDSVGHLGLGTTAPETLLDVSGVVKIRNDLIVQGDIFIQGISSGGEVNRFWEAAGGNNIFYGADGNVGIGVTDATNKLDVIGSIGVSGDILPLENEVFNLGTTLFRFKDLFLSASSIHLGTTAVITADDSGAIDMSSGGGDFVVDGDNQTFFVDVGVSKFVGIGTTSPTEKLSVDGNISILGLNDLLFRRADGTEAATLSSNNEGLTISETRGGEETSLTIGGSDFNFTSNSTDRMIIKADGNVGIGTTIPGELLHINGSAIFGAETGTTGLRIVEASGTVYLQTGIIGTAGSSSDFFIGNIEQATSASARQFMIKADGNVGIGTDTPTAPLHIDTSFVEDTNTRNSMKITTSGGLCSMRFARLSSASDEILDITKNYYRTGAGFVVEDTGTGSHWFQWTTDGSFSFHNAAAGAGVPVERLKIDNVGNITASANISPAVSNQVGALGMILAGYGNNISIAAGGSHVMSSILDGSTQHMYKLVVMGNARITTGGAEVLCRYNSSTSGYGNVTRELITGVNVIGTGSHPGWTVFHYNTTSATNGADYCAFTGEYYICQNNNMTIPASGGSNDYLTFSGYFNSININDAMMRTTGDEATSSNITGLTLFCETGCNAYITYRLYRMT